MSFSIVDDDAVDVGSVRVVTDLPTAERLYQQYAPEPSCWWQQWGLRRALFNADREHVAFLTNSEALLPLQVSETGLISWFGGWAVEQQPWFGSKEGCALLAGLVRVLGNELDWIADPLLGVTAPSGFGLHFLPLLGSWDAWHASLGKKRRYELRQAPGTFEYVRAASWPQIAAGYDQLVTLSVASHDARGTDSYLGYKHDQLYCRRLLDYAKSANEVDMVKLHHGNDVIGVSFGVATKFGYLWGLSASDTEQGPSMGKAMFSAIVRLACDRGCSMIDAGADEAGPTLKTMMGCQQRQVWSLRRGDWLGES